MAEKGRVNWDEGGRGEEGGCARKRSQLTQVKTAEVGVKGDSPTQAGWGQPARLLLRKAGLCP